MVLTIAIVLSVLSAVPLWAAEYTNPDAPLVQTAALHALKSSKVLSLSGKVLEIKGISLGVSGIIEELGGKITEREVTLELSADVLFDFDKAELRAEATDTLTKVSQVINSYGRAPVVIEGHTDSLGADDYNLRLSEKRALAVKNWMQKVGGIALTRMSIKGLGETKPVAENTTPDGKDNPEGRQKNRRVEIRIKTK
jgi:outer membrane protein OmpA-like peptidoglycan-associated protein